MKKQSTGKKLLSAALAALLLSGTAVCALADPPALPPGETVGAPPEGSPGGTPPEDKPDGMPGGNPPSSGVDHYDALAVYSEDAEETGKKYVSEGKDENAVLVTGGTVVLDGVDVSRTSADSAGGDEASFYGVGAAILATGGDLTVSGGKISTDAKGGAGVFAYGDGVVTVKDTEIATKQDASGGIHAAGGGTLYAQNVAVVTEGGSSAAIRSDRGGGVMVVEGGTFTAHGSGSPAVYSTAGIVVKDAVLEADGSEAACIEGRNSLYLFDSTLTGSMPDDAQNDTAWNVILYQSMSGDAEAGNSVFQMTGGTLTAKHGGMFYTTNTESTFILENVTLVPAPDADFLLRSTGNANARGWGRTGENGADCTFIAIRQELTGDVIWDSTGDLRVHLTDGSTLTGALRQITDYGTGDGTASLAVDESSKWVVTANSTLTALHASSGNVVDIYGNNVNIRDTEGNLLVNGSSAVTVTVSTYKEEDAPVPAAALTYEEAVEAVKAANTGSSAPADPGNAPADDRPPEIPEDDWFDGPSGEHHGSMFRDVPPDEWFAEAVAYVYAKGLMNGVGDDLFSPHTGVLRGMAATILWRLEGAPEGGDAPFEDVAEHMYYTDAVAWAAENGIVNGMSETEFAPDDPVTREQLAAMLCRYAAFKGVDTKVKAINEWIFTDMGDISDYAVPAMEWALASGLLNGMGDGTVAPQGVSTRAQLAAILERFCENVLTE